MLLNQGFNKTDEVDLYDAGPRLIAKKEEIHTIKESIFVQILRIQQTLVEPTALLAKPSLQFRSCIGHCQLLNDHECIIDQETATALDVGVNNQILYYPLKRN